MSRAMNLSLPEAKVCQHCDQKNIRVSAIETLPSGGTHLVCVVIEDADRVRDELGKFLIEGRVKRYAYYRTNPR